MTMIAVVLFAAVALAQTNGTACGDVVLSEIKKVTCISSLASFYGTNVDPQTAVNMIKGNLPTICADSCTTELLEFRDKIVARPECAGSVTQQSFDYYGKLRIALCTKTADNQAYCFDKQLAIIEASGQLNNKNISEFASGAVLNRDIVCTDCFKRQAPPFVPDMEQFQSRFCGGNITIVSGSVSGGLSQSNNAIKLALLLLVSGLLFSF